VRGARQVGKSHLLATFGADEFDHCYHFGLEKRRDLLAPLLEKDLNPKSILQSLSLIAGRQICPAGVRSFWMKYKLCHVR
jgi:hypothetical protein